MGPQHLVAILTAIVVTLLVLITASIVCIEFYLGMGGIAVAGTLIGVYLAAPVLFYCFRAVQRNLVFMHIFHLSPGKRFFEPDTHELTGGRNFYLKPEPNVKIGIWHILPISLANGSKGKDPKHWETSLRESGKPVVIYFHGNMGSRGTTHRVELYRLFQNEDCHVLAFDYRGFGDSTGSPSETGLVADGQFLYSWLRDILGKESNVPVYFWGHSLGTGVSTHLASNICKSSESTAPDGLFLEAPFTSMGDAVRNNISAFIYRPLPGSGWLLTAPLQRSDMSFDSARHIRHVNVPITILHDTSDIVVPHKLGKELCNIGNQFRPKGSPPISFYEFKGGSYSTAHVHICREPELVQIIRDFFDLCGQEQEGRLKSRTFGRSKS